MIHIYTPELPSGLDARLINQGAAERSNMPGCALGVMSGPPGAVWASLKLTAAQWGGAVEQLDRCLLRVDSLNRPLPVMQEPELRVEWWFTALQAGGRIGPHDHHQALRTGVYYPQQGNSCCFYAQEHQVELCFHGGTLIEFDPRMTHGVPVVHPDQKGTRWSLAWNIMVP